MNDSAKSSAKHQKSALQAHGDDQERRMGRHSGRAGRRSSARGKVLARRLDRRASRAELRFAVSEG